MSFTHSQILNHSPDHMFPFLLGASARLIEHYVWQFTQSMWWGSISPTYGKKKCCREVRGTYAWEGQKWSGFTVLMQNSDDILTSGFPLTQKLNSDLLGITSSVCMCESSIAEQEAGEKPWVYCCSFWNQWCFGKNLWTVCIPRDSMLHAQQGLLSTCLHTHLSQAGIGGRLSMLWEPNLPIPKHSMQFLESSTW